MAGLAALPARPRRRPARAPGRAHAGAARRAGWAVGAGGERIVADAVVVADRRRRAGAPAPVRAARADRAGQGLLRDAAGRGHRAEPRALPLRAEDRHLRLRRRRPHRGRLRAARPQPRGRPAAARHASSRTPSASCATSGPAQGEGLRDGWAGFRPATPDSLPLLGGVRDQPGLFVAAGHGMLGVTLAPATGAVIADLVDGDAGAGLARADAARPLLLTHRLRPLRDGYGATLGGGRGESRPLRGLDRHHPAPGGSALVRRAAAQLRRCTSCCR